MPAPFFHHTGARAVYSTEARILQVRQTSSSQSNIAALTVTPPARVHLSCPAGLALPGRSCLAVSKPWPRPCEPPPANASGAWHPGAPQWPIAHLRLRGCICGTCMPYGRAHEVSSTCGQVRHPSCAHLVPNRLEPTCTTEDRGVMALLHTASNPCKAITVSLQGQCRAGGICGRHNMVFARPMQGRGHL
jgi:hypothetical protein